MESLGIGRTQIMVAIAIVAVLVLITIPLWVSSSKKGNRAEVPLNVDSIKIAELTVFEAFDEYVSAEAAPRAQTAVDENAVEWAPTPGFKKLAWKPKDEKVYGSYSVVSTSDGFTVTGTCDVDGDGTRAVFTVTEAEGENATMVTEDGIY